MEVLSIVINSSNDSVSLVYNFNEDKYKVQIEDGLVIDELGGTIRSHHAEFVKIIEKYFRIRDKDVALMLTKIKFLSKKGRKGIQFEAEHYSQESFNSCTVKTSPLYCLTAEERDQLNQGLLPGLEIPGTGERIQLNDENQPLFLNLSEEKEIDRFREEIADYISKELHN